MFLGCFGKIFKENNSMILVMGVNRGKVLGFLGCIGVIALPFLAPVIFPAVAAYVVNNAAVVGLGALGTTFIGAGVYSDRKENTGNKRARKVDNLVKKYSSGRVDLKERDLLNNVYLFKEDDSRILEKGRLEKFEGEYYFKPKIGLKKYGPVINVKSVKVGGLEQIATTDTTKSTNKAARFRRLMQLPGTGGDEAPDFVPDARERYHVSQIATFFANVEDEHDNFTPDQKTTFINNALNNLNQLKDYCINTLNDEARAAHYTNEFYEVWSPYLRR
jgi:hypothetical protein